MPSRSMSPSTVEETSVRVTPRAAAMLAMPAVRQAARACSTYSTGVGPLSAPTSTGGWSASNVNGCRWVISCLAPWKPWNVDRLWVPLTQRLVARNWNLAMSVSPFTASSVANRVAVSTPFRTWFSVMVIDLLLNCCWSGRWIRSRSRFAVRSPAPSSAALSSRHEPARSQPAFDDAAPATGDLRVAADQSPVRNGVADGRGSGLAQLVVGSCAKRVVHGGEGDAEGDEGRDREDLRIVVTGVAQRLDVMCLSAVGVTSGLASPPGQRPFRQVQPIIVAPQHTACHTGARNACQQYASPNAEAQATTRMPRCRNVSEPARAACPIRLNSPLCRIGWCAHSLERFVTKPTRSTSSS